MKSKQKDCTDDTRPAGFGGVPAKVSVALTRLILALDMENDCCTIGAPRNIEGLWGTLNTCHSLGQAICGFFFNHRMLALGHPSIITIYLVDK